MQEVEGRPVTKTKLWTLDTRQTAIQANFGGTPPIRIVSHHNIYDGTSPVEQQKFRSKETDMLDFGILPFHSTFRT